MASKPEIPLKSVKTTSKVELSEKHLQALQKRSHLSEDEIRSTFEDFHSMASSGQLSLEEFTKLWSETSPPTRANDPESNHVTKRLFAFFDRDHSGKVDFNEFILASVLMAPGAPTQKLALLFVLCDFNSDGFLSIEEIEHMYLITKAGEDVLDQKEYEAFKTHLKTIFPTYDVKKDGKMSQKEFRNLCTNDDTFKRLIEYFIFRIENIIMSNNVGLSTVSELVRQTSLLNNRQYISAKEGLEFAETAIRTTKSSYASQLNKLDNSFSTNKLSQEDYDKQTFRLKRQLEIDCAPWELYVKKLSRLIEQYSSKSEPQQNNKRTFNQSSSMKKLPIPKRTRITFSSSSSDSDTPIAIIPATTEKKPVPTVIKQDSSTITDPLEFSLRSPFPATPNIISFTAQTNNITQRIPLQHINEIAAKQIVLLHDEGQLVRWNDVIWRILVYFRVQDIGNLGVGRADKIACIDNLIRTQNKINIYLDAYAYWQTIGTLKELENDLARIFFKNDYNELLIGPIEKQPKIEELFRLRHARNEHIKKDLKISDVLKYLDQYMTKETAWKNENELNVDQFLKFIAEQVHVKNINQLGIRMKSAYLARNCIKALQANQRKTMEIARAELDQILADLVQKEIEKISKTINDKLDNHSTSQLRQVYASMNPIDIINDLIEICRDVCHSYSSFRKIFQALDIILKDSMLRNMFQIAICHGKLDMPVRAIESKEASNKAKKIYFDSSDESDTEVKLTKEPCERVVNHPSDNQLLQAFKEQIGSLKSLTFTLLTRIEQRLCEKFTVAQFQELGHDTFSNYIAQNEQLLFPMHIKFNLSSSGCDDKHTTRLVSFEDLEQFIIQIIDRPTDQQYIEQMICYHYQVESFEQLGHGSFRSIFDAIKLNTKPKNTSIHYECLLFDEIPLIKQTLNKTSKSFLPDLEQKALHAINQCSLLGNLHLDTQWNLRFRPTLGKLKVFLSRHKFPILEIDHITFLKLSSNSTLELFKESLYNYDVILTSGHLVSILAQHGSLSNAPLSLLSNIVHTFLLTVPLDHRLYDFLIHIFLRIPFLLLSSIIERIFLQPLIKLEGSQMKMRELLWKTIDKQDPNMILKFIQLGEYLGFTEWSIEKIKIEPIIKIQQEKHVSVSVPNVIVPELVSKMKQKSSANNPHNFIERIRREKFGIGLTLSNESQSLTDQLKSLVGRSLERLSKELYNTDMHFVLELIQNADDNQYHSKPSLVFVIDSNSINVYNNEIGFQEDNIQALCDIGKSTKGKHKQGYIGQKGIGFKSVFTVCDRPEIYSNGYQICFDAANGSIGYILPDWIKDESKDMEYSNWTTRICLPLKSENEMQKHKSRSLTESFNDICPSLLLFLNRLRSITIHNRLQDSKQIYERVDIPGTSIIEIRCEHIIEKWFIIKKQLKVPEEVTASFDDTIEATEIALAFPLHGINNNDEQIILTKQDVYAYLPLRTVPSSRQDILSDSIWNQFLLNEIPTIFLSSLEAFHHEQLSLPIDSLRLFLYFLPNETSIYSNNLFTPVCRTILRLLSSRPFLPVINDDKLHLPNECVLANDSTIKEILTPELLYNHLNLYYLRDDLYKHEKQLLELGVHRLGHNELIDVIKRMFTSEITFENTKILSKWFCCLYRCLNELSLIDEQDVLKHIQSLKIFPLKNHQKFISLHRTNQTIFFPSKNIQLPKLIEHDLMIIDEELWMNLEENSIEINQIQTLLERLGIQRLSHRAVCEQHIFTIFENDNLWKEKPPETLIAYVMYIFELWLKQNHYIDMSRLKSTIQILTNDNFKQPIHHSIYFTQKYGNPYDLAKDFHAYNWLLMSDEYIPENLSVNRRKKLHQFLSELGISDFLFPINNSTYEQFNSLIKIESISMNKRLFLALQENSSLFNDNELFIKHLKESIWIPTVQIFYSYNEQTNDIDLNKIRRLDKAKNIYLRTQQIEQLFGQHVQYIDVEINTNSSFANDIGLIEHITLNDVTSMLLNWCKNSIFYTSIYHMQNIYQYIYENMSINELKELINNNSIFFIPISSSSSSDRKDIVPGRFFSISEVCWCDATNLLVKYSSSFKTIFHYLLEPYYNEQKSIFLDTFTIPMNPTIEEYINLLVHIASLETTENTIQDAFLIFKTIGKWHEQSNNLIDKQDLRNKLSRKSIFPTRDHRWVSLADNPLIADNNGIAQLFTQMKNISMIDIPSPDVLKFFNMCDIKSLSSSITIEHIIQNPSTGVFIQNLLSPLIPYIQLFMKSRPEFSDAYQWTKLIDMSSQLINIQFNIVDHLQLVYRFNSDSSICMIREEKVYYDKNQMTFYIDHEWTEKSKYYRDIFHAFARIFLPYHNDELVRSLGNFMNLLYNEEENNLETFAKYQNFDLELNDSDDIPWRIPSNSKQIQHSEPKIDEQKVRMLLENVAQSQEHYTTYIQKKRQELKKKLSETATITNNQSTESENTSGKE
ncbi:unnamed protein product [Rotaria magnacalcarata]